MTNKNREQNHCSLSRQFTAVSGVIEKNRIEKIITTTTVVVATVAVAAADAIELNFLQAEVKPAFGRSKTFCEAM